MVIDILLTAFYMLLLTLIGLDAMYSKKRTKGDIIYGGVMLFLAGVALHLYCDKIDKLFG